MTGNHKSRIVIFRSHLSPTPPDERDRGLDIVSGLEALRGGNENVS